MRSVAVALVVVVVVIVIVTAVPVPAAAPATDRSTPKTSAVAIFNAVTAGDREALAASLYAENDAQRALASAMADMIVAGKKLGDAAKQKFGSAADPIGRGMLDPSDLSKLEQATVKESGDDTAVLNVPGQPRPMSFRRQDGQWKLVVTDFGGAAPQNIEKQTRLVRAMGEAINTAAAEVAAGKYKTPEEATFAIQQSLHHVMLSFYRPSTTRATTTTSPAGSAPAK